MTALTRGLDATVVPTMLVDRDGLLWVDPREGVYRYDREPLLEPEAGDVQLTCIQRLSGEQHHVGERSHVHPPSAR